MEIENNTDNAWNNNEDIVIIPSKGFKGGSPKEYDTERGHPNNSDSVYTFGDLIRVWKKILF